MNRRGFFKWALIGAFAPRLSPGRAGGATTPADFKFDPLKDIIIAPDDPELWPEFRRRLTQWRAAIGHELNYSDQLYRRADFAWGATNFSCGFLMLCDETVYDPRAGRYRISEFLERETHEFGGFDSVVLWQAYPRMGLDDRNQFDFYRDMPGGVKGLATVVDEFHRAGVKVFLAYNPWDTGTRRESQSDLDALSEMVGALAADGIFLDTLNEGATEFRGKLDAARPGVALESEGALPLGRVQDHHFSWAQEFSDSAVPGVLRNKWFERRHLQHQIKRWDFDHTTELQTAWMNGSGIMVWENVFGSWMGWSPRDKSILRQMLPIQRRYASLFCGAGWTPLVRTLAKDLYGSLWHGADMRLWTLVNRSGSAVNGSLLAVEIAAGESVFDLTLGQEVSRGRDQNTKADVSSDKEIILNGFIPPRGIGCFIVAQPAALGRDFPDFLEAQRKLNTRFSTEATYPGLPTRIKPAPPSRKWRRVPEGMGEISGASLTLRVEMRERECGFYESSPASGPRFADVYNFRTRLFERAVVLKRFAMDLLPVTNAQFVEFLRAADYRPRQRENFLKHWTAGVPPAGKEDHPVVYVDLDDARAYANWAGKRLPTEDEWQYAAQGPAGLKFPWGNELLGNRCNGGETHGTTPVNQFPEGRSPFGIWDLCGNVWEWTESERTDGRTRFCILKGGSFYTAKGSGWYMDGGPRPNDFSEKFLMMWPGLDRCATIGFRCVVDLD